MKTKVLITVKTYPTLSTKYDELVCTAGFTEDGSWIRIYPVEFRKKAYKDQYKKYDWVEVDLVKNDSDFRPESYRPVTANTSFEKVDELDTKGNWAKRKDIVLKKVHNDLTKLIEEAQNRDIGTSLAVFKPSKIVDFIIEPVDREWDDKKLASLQQFNLFESTDKGFEVVKKLPYKFSYKFEDVQGRQSTLMIEDWEIGQLFWNCLNREGNEERACELVKKKYIDDFAKTKDLHLFLGTTKRFHFTGRNPFVIIGTFTPKIEIQTKLDF
ncbi:hypothetical protein L0P88_08530 [Muricauda sp. SCSIO 64092]|uniref:hypothetical protein n=1 Tax=Allomuricauda sp. SCSIO 64092 TaxID=2908842 RepID=UPI001FF6CBE6|nr:hypothetical protein [Muricauda sp. SCSIO 64092]UOY08586.1 hypothetical protein L0P88_08530 [Muricauda sp. SCSIO 64092]